jgi:hypothetical protein
MLPSGSWLSLGTSRGILREVIARAPVLLLTVHSRHMFVFLSCLSHEVKEAALYHILVSPEQPTCDAKQSRSANPTCLTEHVLFLLARLDLWCSTSGDMPWEKAPFLVERVIDVGLTGLASKPKLSVSTS